MIILDCEDAVKEEDKASARGAALLAAREGFGERLCAIRINAPGTTHYGSDVIALRGSNVDVVILPKVETPQQVRDAANLSTKPVLAMIETAAGVMHAPTIAPATGALIVGTNDLSADLGLPLDSGRGGLLHALQAVVLAARASRIAAFDGVFNKLDDGEGLEKECREGRSFGFDGKSLIHPNQIEAANKLFGPSDEEVDAAQRLIAAATGGAERFDNRMIESMHVEQAHAVLAKARR